MQVHVWLPNEEHVGHTSLSIGEDYISFWPDGSAGKKDLKIKRSHAGMLVPSLHEDIVSEGHRQPTTIELTWLNEEAVLDYIVKLRANTPRYQLARNNCSHVVAGALEAGAGDKASFRPHAGRYGGVGRVLGVGIWTPDQVLKFARELQAKAT
jgi:hypothetical protein